MRRPGLHQIDGRAERVGLSHLLVGQARVREAVQRTSEPNLFVITAGRTPPNPSELLASERMKSFLANLTHGPFDWVVLDTPPVLAVTDAVVLAGQVSARGVRRGLRDDAPSPCGARARRRCAPASRDRLASC